jgi:hypothetical protein
MTYRKKRVRRLCSHCRKAGHTIRRCPTKHAKKENLQNTKTNFLIDDLSENEVLSSHIEKENKKGPKRIHIKTFVDNSHSQHIVNLRIEDTKETLWDNVDVFEQKREKKSEIGEIDFSDMIRNRVEEDKVEKESFEISTKISARGGLVDVEEKTQFKFSMPTINFPVFKWEKLAVVSIALFLIFIIPFPVFGYYKKLKQSGETAIVESTNAFLALQSSTVAALSSDIETAQVDLNTALQAFSKVETLITTEHKYLLQLLRVVPFLGSKIESRQHILSAGQHVTLANTYLVKGIKDAKEQEHMLFTDRVSIIEDHLQAAHVQYRAAFKSLNNVNVNDLPEEYRQPFLEFKLLFGTFVDDIGDIYELLDTFKMVFGHDDFKRYLVVFQNQHELRATGGFMGGYAVVDVQKGRILNIDIPSGGTYDVQGQLEKNILPPAPLQMANSRWEFQDANWFPDFEESAKKMAWFYNETRKSSVDGVIAVNASVLQHVLAIVGDISLEEYDMTINSENVLIAIQDHVETGYEEINEKPKAILGVLFEKIMERTEKLSTEDILTFVTKMHTAFKEKEMQAYFFDKNIQKEVSRFGWDGKIVDTFKGQDYLYVVNTNINGGKSDAKIVQHISHEAHIEEDGSIVNIVTIKRKHTGTKGEKFYGVGNIDYMRVYVPQGAELVEASGFVYPEEKWFSSPRKDASMDEDLKRIEKGEKIHKKTGTRITNEFGKTVFANWVITLPGETQEVKFVYRLPFFVNRDALPINNFEKWKDQLKGQYHKRSASYSMYVQKQSGINSDIRSVVFFPKNWDPVWFGNANVYVEEDFILFKDELKTDIVLGTVFEETSI